MRSLMVPRHRTASAPVAGAVRAFIRLSRWSRASSVSVTHQSASPIGASQGTNQLASKPRVYAPRNSRTEARPADMGAGAGALVATGSDLTVGSALGGTA